MGLASLRQQRKSIECGEWQANQSLQAFIPCRSQEQATAIHSELSEKWVEDYLLSLRMEGSMNWAQLGKIKKLLTLTTDVVHPYNMNYSALLD